MIQKVIPGPDTLLQFNENICQEKSDGKLGEKIAEKKGKGKKRKRKRERRSGECVSGRQAAGTPSKQAFYFFAENWVKRVTSHIFEKSAKP